MRLKRTKPCWSHRMEKSKRAFWPPQCLRGRGERWGGGEESETEARGRGGKL